MASVKKYQIWLLLFGVTSSISLFGMENSAPSATTHPNDPLESANRAVFRFNKGVDTGLLRPVAEGYQKVIPSPARTGIANFFDNLKTPITAVNALLQGKWDHSLEATSRFVFNSTFGALGVFDIATLMDINPPKEDFGQTLATWGVGEGAYLMLPFYGPSNVRDAVGKIFDWPLDLAHDHEVDETRYGFMVFSTVSARAGLLGASKALEATGADEYLFMQNSYHQKRLYDVYDGNPPSNEETFDPFRENP